MGFFSSLVKGLGAVVGAVINPAGTIAGLLGGKGTTPTPAAVAAATPAAPVKAPTAQLSTGAPFAFGAAGALIGGAALRPAIQGIAPKIAGSTIVAIKDGVQVGGPADRGLDVTPGRVGQNITAAQLAQAGIMGGNGQFSKRTIVQTINLATGLVVKTVVFDGAPFLMNKEVASLARVTRKLGKASRKIPRRVVKQSLASRLSEAALTDAIDGVGKNGKCC